MVRKVLVALTGLLLAVSVLLVFTGCGGAGAGTSNQRIRPTFVEPAITGENVAVSLAEVQAKKMIHFRVLTPAGKEVFMAYDLPGKTMVRASVCVPCQSQSFSLEGTTLVCDACGTKFSATSGDGISGACVAYPKAAVEYTVVNGNITMTTGSLVAAYQNTLKPGKP